MNAVPESATQRLDDWLSAAEAALVDDNMRAAQWLVQQLTGEDESLLAAWQRAEPLLIDSLDTLLKLQAGPESLAATILHALVDAGADLAEAQLQPFTANVRELLAGQQAAGQVWSLYALRSGGGSAEGLRRLLLAIIRDLRVVFILLARQLAQLRHAPDLPPDEAHALAQMTADIHAPLANRLGIWQLKWELEDLAFRQLQPETYQRIARLLVDRRAERESFIAQACSELTNALQAAGIQAEVAGRPKHIYSIWRKMQNKGLEFSDLYDIRALRVLVDDMPQCYAALGVVHSLWPYIPGEFDDYITAPKGNQYQSLHTAVRGPAGKTLEVQIRSHEMHEHAELGVAAHWRYKEGGGGDASFERKISWLRQLLDDKDEGDDEAALLAGFRTDVLDDRVYLLTPKGDVIDMPRGATVLDFAYLIHTDVGHRCRGAKVNGRIVPLHHQPDSGQRVEILVGKISEPRRDWLSPHHGYLKTPRALQKVRAWFKHTSREQNLHDGRLLLERELRRLAVSMQTQDGLPGRFGLKGMDELYEALALGDVTAGQIARQVHEASQPPAPEPLQTTPAPAPASTQAPAGAFVIEGVGNLLTQLAGCCQPVPGDAISGFITRGSGVKVHRRDCMEMERLRNSQPRRVVDVDWGSSGRHGYDVEVLVEGWDRKGLHKDVTNVIALTEVRLDGVDSRVDRGDGRARMRFKLRVVDFDQLSALLQRILTVPNVIDARRMS